MLEEFYKHFEIGFKKYRDGEPCSHKGCLNHVSHPCECCGRFNGVSIELEKEGIINKQAVKEIVE
jgi:hypothetical protein